MGCLLIHEELEMPDFEIGCRCSGRRRSRAVGSLRRRATAATSRLNAAGDLWVPKMSSTSRHQPVFVNEATEPVGPHYASELMHCPHLGRCWRAGR